MKEGTTMNNVTKNLTIAMALTALAGGIASAQSMRADIPFAFRVGEKLMPAASYQLNLTGDRREALVIRSSDRKTSALAVSSGWTMAAKSWTATKEPMLAFDCGGGRCTLAQLWDGESRDAYTFARRQTRGTEHAALTEIRLVRLAE